MSCQKNKTLTPFAGCHDNTNNFSPQCVFLLCMASSSVSTSLLHLAKVCIAGHSCTHLFISLPKVKHCLEAENNKAPSLTFDGHNKAHINKMSCFMQNNYYFYTEYTLILIISTLRGPSYELINLPRSTLSPLFL